MAILVTGGAGYIGAHVVRLLAGEGRRVVVVDDLSTGSADRLAGATLHVLDVANSGQVPRLRSLLTDEGVDTVVHLAAKKQVAESVADPELYHRQNVGGMVNLLAAMREAEIGRLVYSSSAAVYGEVAGEAVDEDSATAPTNPYGETKLIGERLARQASREWGLRAVSLRYFNVAGAGRPELGDPAVGNLVTMVLDRLWRAEAPLVFGADYDTPDGSCVRDFVHVVDLAEAHLAAVAYLDRDDRPFDVFNVGTGRGASVREVVDRLVALTGASVAPLVVERRDGDPARVVASPERIAGALGWRARLDLDAILDSAWQAWLAQHAPR